MIFEPQKGGVIFLTFQPPFPTPPQKIGFQVAGRGSGGGGGSRPNTHWGMRLLVKKLILSRVRQTIQPLEVGHANRPKRGVCGIFSDMQACLALI